MDIMVHTGKYLITCGNDIGDESTNEAVQSLVDSNSGSHKTCRQISGHEYRVLQKTSKISNHRKNCLMKMAIKPTVNGVTHLALGATPLANP